jgi:GntR family transcriptional regulator
MKNSLDENKPIFLQIKEQIEDSIMNGEFNPEDKVPSTNEFANFYKINPATAGKGINELVADGILYKRRGVGMFVTEEARDILIESRKQQFYEKFMLPLKKEAEKLGMDSEDLIQMMKRGDSRED